MNLNEKLKHYAENTNEPFEKIIFKKTIKHSEEEVSF